MIGRAVGYEAMKKTLVFGVSSFLLLVSWSVATKAQSITEGFENVPVLLDTGGWVDVNNSDVPNNAFDWRQGSPGTGVNDFGFNAQSGPANSFAEASFGATSGVILSDWLLTPEVTLQAGDTISFWTTATLNATFANDLQVAISLNGSSTNVGSNAQTPVGGNFNVLTNGDINPTLSVNGYPQGWTEFTFTLTSSEVPTAALGRIGLRYYVPIPSPKGQPSESTLFHSRLP